MTLRSPWAIALMTSAGIFVTFVLRVNMSPVAPIMQRNLQLSDFQLGLVLSGFLWTYTFLQPVAGWFTDRFGAKLSMLMGVLATSIITILTGFANSFLALFSLRIVLGATQAPNFVSGAKVTASEWFDEEQRARATSIWVAGGRLGPVLAFPFAAWLGVNYGWVWALYATGIVGIVWCAAWFLGFDDAPHDPVAVGKPKHGLRIRESLSLVLGPLGLGFALASFGQGYVAYYLNLWLPMYLVREQKFTVLSASLFSTLPLIAAVVTLLLVGGVMSDYLVKRGLSPFGLRRNLFAFGMTMTAIMLFATAYAPNPYVAIAALSLAGASLGFSTPSLWTALVEVTPKDVTGTMGGVMNFGGNLAGIVVSILTSYILDITNSFFIALLMASIMALLGAISTLVFVRPKLGLDPQMETEQYMIVLYELQPASLLSQRS